MELILPGKNNVVIKIIKLKMGWYRAFALLMGVKVRGFLFRKGSNKMKNIKEDEKLNVLNHSCAHLLDRKSVV